MKYIKTNCGIYKIINLVDSKVYIGSSVNLKNRKYNHFSTLRSNRHTNDYLQKAYNKHGEESFKFEIIEYIEKSMDTKLLKEELLIREQYYLNRYILNDKINSSKCYNLCPYAINKLGYKHTLESKEKMSISQKLRFSEGIHPARGRKLSDSHKELLKKMAKERKPSKEELLKRSNSSKGRIKSAEECRKIRESKKIKIVNLDTEEIFDSILEASQFYGIVKGNITKVCRGDRKTAGGYRWSYFL